MYEVPYIYIEREIERETNSKLVTQNSESQIVSQTFKRSLSASAKFAVISIFKNAVSLILDLICVILVFYGKFRTFRNIFLHCFCFYVFILE